MALDRMINRGWGFGDFMQNFQHKTPVSNHPYIKGFWEVRIVSLVNFVRNFLYFVEKDFTNYIMCYILLCGVEYYSLRLAMILLTRINKVTQFYLNEEMIEFIEETPDTIISLNTGKKIAVMETPVEVIEKIREEKIKIAHATRF